MTVLEFRNITKISILTGMRRTRTIAADPRHWEAWKKGALVQVAFPDLSKSDREFLVSGIVDEEWESLKDE